MSKNLVLIVEANQPYIRNIDENLDFSEQNDILFSAITNSYLPFLNMLARLSSESFDFKLGLVISSPLCSLLTDSAIQRQYVDYLDKIINLGKSELERNRGTKFETLSQKYLNDAIQAKIDFTETYEYDLIKAFKLFAKKGILEIIPTAATYAYLPFYSHIPEVLKAQIETGLYSQKYYFGDMGEGFMLPYCGFSKPLDKILRSYGINYTILDAKSLLFCEKYQETGIFSPVRCNNSLVLFACDPNTSKEIYGEDGFCKNEIYRSQNHDIGFELNSQDLGDFLESSAKRVQTIYKYFALGDDEESCEIYDFEKASEQSKKDAQTFYESKFAQLSKVQEMMSGKSPCLVCTIPLQVLGQSWYEGILWLENLIRIACEKNDLALVSCNSLLENQFSLPKIEPYPCSSNGFGYGEDLLDNSNSWMFRYVQKASNRMVYLAEKFPNETSLKARLLNLGAKELLLAQSGEWPMMIHDQKIPDFVSEQFKNEILNFTRVFDALASNTVSTEWLTSLEKKDVIFPWMNYRIFSPKK